MLREHDTVRTQGGGLTRLRWLWLVFVLPKCYSGPSSTLGAV